MEGCIYGIETSKMLDIDILPDDLGVGIKALFRSVPALVF